MLHALNEKLIELDIKRNYYALILIEEGQGKLTQQELAVLLESDKVSVVRIVRLVVVVVVSINVCYVVG